jgi:hypothetical protein
VGDLGCQALKSTSAALTGALTAASASLTGVLSCSYLTQTAPPVGYVHSVRSYDDAAASWSDQTITGAAGADLGSVTYQPLSASSAIHVSIYGYRTRVEGDGADGDYVLQTLVTPSGGSVATLAETRLKYSATGRKDGTVDFLAGVYTNAATTALTFRVHSLRNQPSGSTDSNLVFHSTSRMYMTVTEVQR